MEEMCKREFGQIQLKKGSRMRDTVETFEKNTLQKYLIESRRIQKRKYNGELIV